MYGAVGNDGADFYCEKALKKGSKKFFEKISKKLLTLQN